MLNQDYNATTSHDKLRIKPVWVHADDVLKLVKHGVHAVMVTVDYTVRIQ